MSSPARSKKPATSEDLLRVPGNMVAEIVGGICGAIRRRRTPDSRRRAARVLQAH